MDHYITESDVESSLRKCIDGPVPSKELTGAVDAKYKCSKVLDICKRLFLIKRSFVYNVTNGLLGPRYTIDLTVILIETLNLLYTEYLHRIDKYELMSDSKKKRKLIDKHIKDIMKYYNKHWKRHIEHHDILNIAVLLYDLMIEINKYNGNLDNIKKAMLYTTFMLIKVDEI